MNTNELYWISGLFEGEGCLSINKNRNISAMIGMTDEDIIDRVDKLYPGLRYVRNRADNHKDLYVWQINGKQAYEFVKMVRPFLGKRRLSKANELIAQFEQPHNKHNRRQIVKSKVASLLKQGYNGRMIAKELTISESYVSLLRKEIG